MFPTTTYGLECYYNVWCIAVYLTGHSCLEKDFSSRIDQCFEWPEKWRCPYNITDEVEAGRQAGQSVVCVCFMIAMFQVTCCHGRTLKLSSSLHTKRNSSYLLTRWEFSLILRRHAELFKLFYKLILMFMVNHRSLRLRMTWWNGDITNP